MLPYILNMMDVNSAKKLKVYCIDLVEFQGLYNNKFKIEFE